MTAPRGKTRDRSWSVLGLGFKVWGSALRVEELERRKCCKYLPQSLLPLQATIEPEKEAGKTTGVGNGGFMIFHVSLGLLQPLDPKPKKFCNPNPYD